LVGRQQISDLFKLNFLPYFSSKLPNSIPLLDLCLQSQEIVRSDLQNFLKQWKLEVDPIQYLSNLKLESEIDVMNQQVIGHTQIKEIILDSILLPRQYFNLYQQFNINPTTGILLYGPPGTGKTFIASSIATSLSGTFVNIKLSDIMSGQIGVAEQKIRDIFTYAKLCTPSIIFIDEFQAIFTAREGQGDNRDSGSSGQQMLTSALAGCLDDIGLWNHSAGLQTMITIIAATNEPWAIDRGFFRSGRFDQVLHVGIMSKEDRAKLLQFQFDEIKKKGFNIEDRVVVGELAEKLNYFTSADICHYIKVVFEEYLFSEQVLGSGAWNKIIPAKIFETVLAKSIPTCCEEEIREYIEWEKEMQRHQ
jgi:SpoVK/Ycf46/Vps4 family AAA+-type ATPase